MQRVRQLGSHPLTACGILFTYFELFHFCVDPFIGINMLFELIQSWGTLGDSSIPCCLYLFCCQHVTIQKELTKEFLGEQIGKQVMLQMYSKTIAIFAVSVRLKDLQNSHCAKIKLITCLSSTHR